MHGFVGALEGNFQGNPALFFPQADRQLEGEMLAADSKLTPVINMASRMSSSPLR